MYGLRQSAAFYWVAAVLLLLFALPSWDAGYERWEMTFVLLSSAMLLAGGVATPWAYRRAKDERIGQSRTLGLSVMLVALSAVTAVVGLVAKLASLMLVSLIVGALAGIIVWVRSGQLERPHTRREALQH